MLTVTDMFCGAGGSSTGAVAVPGIEVAIAMNHWARAIETHNTNHPTVDHVQADISQFDPRRIFATDILWASPECTNHTVAKGRKRITNQASLFGDDVDESAERSRATMWDVPRYAEQHRYKLIITENVVEAARWLFFDEWISCMHKLGYQHRMVFMNSMHAQLGGLPAPQSRDRMYVVFWLRGNKAPDFERLRPPAVCPMHGTVNAMQVFKKTEHWGRYRAQYVFRCPHSECRNQIVEPGWLPAASAIDWDIEAQRIGDRKRPLAQKTLNRIQAGLDRFGPARIAVDAVRGAPILSNVDRDPFLTQTTSYTRGLLMPYYGSSKPQSTDNPIGTLTTVDRYALITSGDAPEHPTANVAIEDCYFRMLEPKEVTAGMAFPKEYIMTGTKREQVKQAGNAVTPPAARDLIMMASESLLTS